MEKSLIAAFKSMLTMHRWNLHPKVETWVEAENAALRAHWAYAIMKGENETADVPKKDIIHLILRILLKSLNKHYMTDISVFVTKKLKNKEEWKSVVDGYAADTAKLFPREISGVIHRYLLHEGDYAGGWGDGWGEMASCISNDTEKKIDTIIHFSKLKVQDLECKINGSVYKEHYDKSEIIKDIQSEISEDKYKDYNRIMKDKSIYFETIAHLKYLRRWNTLNRFNLSSVLGHTYIVSILALMFSLSDRDKKEKTSFIYEALLRSLFHDVPEAVTGDIVTPVKDRFRDAMPEKEQKKSNKGADIITKIEKDLIADFVEAAPGTVGKEIGSENGGLNLLDPLNNNDVGECVSLVKDCDRLALVLECLYEKEAKVIAPEMEEAYHQNCRELNNSEWSSVRRFLSVLSDQWRLND